MSVEAVSRVGVSDLRVSPVGYQEIAEGIAPHSYELTEPYSGCGICGYGPGCSVHDMNWWRNVAERKTVEPKLIQAYENFLTDPRSTVAELFVARQHLGSLGLSSEVLQKVELEIAEEFTSESSKQ